MKICYLLVLFVCLLSCRHDDAKTAIARSNSLYFESFVLNDVKIFLQRYATDACILAPNGPAGCGRAAQEAFFHFAHDSIGLRNGQFITTAIYGEGTAYVTEEGLWKSFDKEGHLFDDGKFLVLWKRTPEGWKMYRDSFSSNRK